MSAIYLLMACVGCYWLGVLRGEANKRHEVLAAKADAEGWKTAFEQSEQGAEQLHEMLIQHSQANKRMYWLMQAQSVPSLN